MDKKDRERRFLAAKHYRSLNLFGKHHPVTRQWLAQIKKFDNTHKEDGE